MATKVITICDHHRDRDEDSHVEATHHNTWTNLRGERRRVDLCDEHQKLFTEAWEAIEECSVVVPKEPADSKAGRGRRSRAKGGQPTEAALVRAWAKSVGEPVSEQGRVSFTVERKWHLAGRPNVLTG
ncbi:Lsr2 protein [Streptosporangium canum]|uniref:Lsr2 protein n=1 Tax=Streptosporangium canum TaxID=324952 RepID=A0A1I3L7A0_9ACTN|nr:histone-like nucleoid-structuring protein Lsr2 [Streptosporangium canum]SFI80480.1 Lsr2 protein [Streptosporangium canum]